MSNEISDSYLAGLFDGAVEITFRVKEDEMIPTGYECQAGLRFETVRDPALVGALAEYAEDHDILSQTLKTSEGYVWLITGADRVKQFLKSIEDKQWRRNNDIDLMIDEIIPRLRSNDHHTEDGLIELMEYASQLEWRQKFNQYNRYTKAAFIEEFKGQ